MFDANAAHIKEGELFFAEVHGADSQLLSAGIHNGDIIMVSHVAKSLGRPRDNLLSKIWKSKECDPIEWTSNGSREFSWMVYSGRPDGTGFINDQWKAKALAFMGGNFEKINGDVYCG